MDAEQSVKIEKHPLVVFAIVVKLRHEKIVRETGGKNFTQPNVSLVECGRTSGIAKNLRSFIHSQGRSRNPGIIGGGRAVGVPPRKVSHRLEETANDATMANIVGNAVPQLLGQLFHDLVLTLTG